MSARDYPVEPIISEVSAYDSGDDEDIGEYEGNQQNPLGTPLKEGVSPRRLSLSDTNLPSRNKDSAATIGKAQSQMSLGPQQHGSLPIRATMMENQELKSQLQMCRTELDIALYKEREARALLSRDVQDILNEHYKVQLDSLETSKKLQQLDELHSMLQKVTHERDEAVKDLADGQRTAQMNIASFEEAIQQLNKQLEAARSQATVGYQDFTLASSIGDSEVLELQQKLEDALQENAQILLINEKLQKDVESLTSSLNDGQIRSAVDKTSFMIGNNEREQELLAKLDALESDHKQKEDAMLGVIQSLLTNESALKKKLEKQKCDRSLSETQLVLSDRNQLLNLVERLETELSNLRADNRAMRHECARIKGVELEESDASLAEPQASDNAPDVGMDLTGGPSEIDDMLNRLRNMNQHMKTEYGLDFNLSNAEQVQVGGTAPINATASFSGHPRLSMVNRSAFATGNEISLTGVNASFADVLQVSIHASEDVRLVKIKLDTLKDLLVSMFERLRGSANVLDEVYKYLSNGSPDNREVAEKIRQMKFEFSAMTCKDSAVEQAVIEAEQSMGQLQTSLCVFEQSLTQTASFIMETTRRSSFAPNQSHLQPTPGISTNDFGKYEQAIFELQEKVALSEISLDEMKGLVTSTKIKLAEVTEARDKALLSADSLKQQIDELKGENTELTSAKFKLTSELQTAQSSINTLTDDLQELTDTSDDLRQTVKSLESDLQISKKDLEIADERHQMQEHEKREIKLSISEISQKFMASQEELERMKTLLDERMQSYEGIRLSNEELLKMYRQIELDNIDWKGKCADLETALKKKDRAMSAQKERLVEESSAAKETMSMLGLRVAELEDALDGYESKDVRLSRAPNGLFELSCIQRATNVNKMVMTDFTGQSVDDLIEQTKSQSSEITRLQAVYSMLSTAIYSSIATCSPPSHMYKTEISSIESASRELAELLEEAQQKNTLALEQLDAILAKQQNEAARNGDLNAQVSTLQYKHLTSPIDSLRYNSKLRQDFYWLTSLSADLTANLKSVEKVLCLQNKVDFLRLIDDSRKIRNGLNERLALITRTDKENVIPQTMTELVDMNTLLRTQNHELHLTLKENRTKLEALMNEVSLKNGAPELLSKIQGELTKIEKVMSTACEGVRNVPRK